MKLGQKIYQEGILKPETTKMIETVFEGYDAVVKRAQTEKDPSIITDLDHIHQLVSGVRTCIIRKNEEAAVEHLQKAMDIMQKWLKMNRSDVIESFYRACDQITKDAAQDDQDYPLNATARRAYIWLSAESQIKGAYLCSRMLIHDTKDIDALDTHNEHFGNLVSKALLKVFGEKPAMAYVAPRKGA